MPTRWPGGDVKGTRISLKDWRRAEELIQQDFSSEQVSGFLSRQEELSISHKTIYAYVWRDNQVEGHLYVHLRGANKKRRKRYGRNDSRGRLAGNRNISERPPAVEKRIELGYGEADTVIADSFQRLATGES